MRKIRLSWVELATALALIVVIVVIILPFIQRIGREAINPARCQNNLKQMGLVFKMYANESKGTYYPPPMPSTNDTAPFVPVPSIDAIVPEYLTDIYVLACPGSSVYAAMHREDVTTEDASKERVRKRLARSYTYYGWLIDKGNTDDPAITASEVVEALGLETLPEGLQGAEQLPGQVFALHQAVLTAKKEGAENIQEQHYPVEDALGNQDFTNVYRIKEVIHNCWAPLPIDKIQKYPNIIQSNTPVMWDTLNLKPDTFIHKPGGLNVLYMDGHAEFKQYPSNTFPANEGMAVWSRFNEVLLFGE